jgi:hypothetical protein
MVYERTSVSFGLNVKISIAINSRKSRQMRRDSLTKCRTRRRITCGDEVAKMREGGQA